MTDPVAYDYVRLILEQEFLAVYLRFIDQGVLHYELTNIMEVCSPLLTGLDEEDRFLKQEIIGTIAHYLEEQ